MSLDRKQIIKIAQKEFNIILEAQAQPPSATQQAIELIQQIQLKLL